MMRVSFRYSRLLHSRWIFGTLALAFLSACATPRAAEQGQTSNDDAVDIGYGTADREHLTGSVATISGDEQRADGAKTLADMIQGQAPGVWVRETAGGGISVRIRGSNSFLGGEEPLWILDGMMISAVNGGLAGLNPKNIHSITVLKDAGSTAVYGSRGANGVILIKTKKGGG